MDNNQPMPNQPYYGPQPMPGQPVPNGQPMPNQPMGPGQPMPPYPPQPMMRPPKQPMDPAKKKKIILIVSICSGVLVLGIIAAIVILILLRVDYGPTYAAAKELKTKVRDIYYDYDCENVIDYVDSTYTAIKRYSEYVESCKKVYGSETNDLIAKLENSDGVKRNNEIKAQFEKFKSEYAALSAGDSEDLEAKLSLWQARHNFVVTADDLSTSSSDAEYAAAAKYLIDSGNDVLKTYGEGWLERRTAINAAYRAYYDASYSDPNYSQLRDDYNNKKSEYNQWLPANKPDIKTVAPLGFNDTSKMYNEFTKLYDLIAKTYEQNYNSGSGDCTEFLGEVSCD